MKRFILIMVGLLTLSIAAHAAVGDEIGYYEIKYEVTDEENKEVAVIGYRWDAEFQTKFEIPERFWYKECNYKVTSIRNDAFKEMPKMETVTIPNTVTSIGARAFYKCAKLTSANIPNALVTIGDGAFYETALSKVTIPKTMTSIGSHAFYKTRIKTVTIPNSVITIGDNAFGHCQYLQEINIKEGNVNYNSYDGVLYNHDLTIAYLCPMGKKGAVAIPGSVVSIENAFDYCDGLTAMNVEDGNKNYKSVDGLLYSPDMTTLIRCPEGRAFDFTIPGSVTAIANKAFFSNAKLDSSFTIPNSIKTIGEYAFANCSNIYNETIIPNSVTSIGSYAFYNSGAMLEELPNSVTSIGDFAFSSSVLRKMDIPNSVTSMGTGVFKNCWSLKSVTFPNSLSRVPNSSFSGCVNLAEFNIPNTVTTIGEGAFGGCTSLREINIPNSVTTIESAAFTGCVDLKTVTLHNSVTSIGDFAFSGCNALYTISIPDSENPWRPYISIHWNILPTSLTRIESRTFSSCTSLTLICIPDKVTFVGQGAFSGCNHLGIFALPKNPPVIPNENYENPFTEVSRSGLVVLKGCASDYASALGWDYFLHISEVDLGEAGVENPECDADDSEAEYYNLNGIRMNGYPEAPGLYIKRQGGKSEKFLVK